MRIGITCYPTYGGSGVVATELGLELAQRGHQVHFISYSQPIRLTEPLAQHSLSRGRGLAVSAVRISAVRSGAGDAHGRSRRDLRARSAACALRDSAFGERDAGAADAVLRSRAPTAAGCLTSPRCTAPTSRWSAPIRPICRSRASPSIRATASPRFPNYLKQRTRRSLRREDADRSHSELRELRSLRAHAGGHEAALRVRHAGREDPGASVELPSGEAHSRCHRDLRSRAEEEFRRGC